MIVIFWVIGLGMGTSYSKAGWNRAIRKRFDLFDEAEKHDAFMPDGRSWRQEMIRIIYTNSIILLDDIEFHVIMYINYLI